MLQSRFARPLVSHLLAFLARAAVLLGVFVPDVFAELEAPSGFEVTVAHPGVGSGARHIAVRDTGDVYVRFRSEPGGILALRDSNRDGVFDSARRFDASRGTGIQFFEEHLYFSTNDAVLRVRLKKEALVPEAVAEVVVRDFPAQNQHAAKAIAINKAGELFVNIGAPSNACQVRMRTAGSPGERPCKQLEQYAGIWRFDARKTKQSVYRDGVRYVTGMRNAVALAWDNVSSALYLVQHGRDQLSQFWPKFYTDADNAALPAEEFHRVQLGSNIGWPYTYYDQRRKARMIAPEYGGDGRKRSENAAYQDPLIGFPGHWAPNDLLFYTGSQFPTRYRGGAFIAFHGSWNRAPLPQKGYKVVFVPREAEGFKRYETFLDGFAGRESIEASWQATYRPIGLAEATDGSLFVLDSKVGRLWRIRARA